MMQRFRRLGSDILSFGKFILALLYLPDSAMSSIARICVPLSTLPSLISTALMLSTERLQHTLCLAVFLTRTSSIRAPVSYRCPGTPLLMLASPPRQRDVFVVTVSETVHVCELVDVRRLRHIEFTRERVVACL